MGDGTFVHRFFLFERTVAYGCKRCKARILRCGAGYKKCKSSQTRFIRHCRALDIPLVDVSRPLGFVDEPDFHCGKIGQDCNLPHASSVDLKSSAFFCSIAAILIKMIPSCISLPMNPETAQTSIALVEDDPNMARLIDEMLTTAGVNVAIFALGADLLKCTDRANFRAIILDLSLPDIDGFELLEAMAALCLKVPVLLSSGHDQGVIGAAESYGRALGLPLLGALQKPFSRSQLFSALGILE